MEVEILERFCRLVLDIFIELLLRGGKRSVSSSVT